MNTNNIEDIVPLSPLQQGMLFHSLYSPEAGMYLSQLSCTFEGLNVKAFEGAWQRVVDRHSIFRTAFIWEGLDEPVQVVFRRLNLLVNRLDYRELSAAEREERVTAYIDADRRRDFNYSQAPLMRISILQLAEGVYKYVWTYHHLLMDSWSEFLLSAEVEAFYEAFRKGEELELEPCRPYTDYIAWLAKQKISEAERFWRRTLKGCHAPPRLSLDRLLERRESQETGYGEHHVILSAEKTTELRQAASRYQLTPATMINGAWALLLSHYSQARDVVIGMNVSGRPAALPGVETIVGPFINTLPLRVQISPHSPLLPWLKGLQDRLAEVREYEYSPLAQVQMWSEIPRGQTIFESFVAYQCTSVRVPMRARRRESTGLQIRDIRFRGGWTNYPLALDAKLKSETVLNLSYDRRRFDSAAIQQILFGLETLLLAFVNQPSSNLEDLFKVLAELDDRQQVQQEEALEATNLQMLKKTRRKAIHIAGGK
jgi:Condensation domain